MKRCLKSIVYFVLHLNLILNSDFCNNISEYIKHIFLHKGILSCGK